MPGGTSETFERRALSWSAVGGVRGVRSLAREARNFVWHHHVQEMRRAVARPAHRPDPASWPDTGIHAAWLGHSTVLMKIDGFTILTDPALFSRVGLGFGPVTVGLKRLVAPALRPSQLPAIDLILLSHAHLDHCDTRTLRRLANRSTAIVAAHRMADLLPARHCASLDELRWGDVVRIGPAEIRAFEVNHWGARLRTDVWRGYNGYMIDTGRRRVLFAGDTANSEVFRWLRTSRPVDLAIMPIGAYNPWIHYHCTPEQAWRMANDAGAEHVLPVHHGTFRLGREPAAEPLERLLNAASRNAHRVVLHGIGETWHSR